MEFKRNGRKEGWKKVQAGLLKEQLEQQERERQMREQLHSATQVEYLSEEKENQRIQDTLHVQRLLKGQVPDHKLEGGCMKAEFLGSTIDQCRDQVSTILSNPSQPYFLHNVCSDPSFFHNTGLMRM